MIGHSALKKLHVPFTFSPYQPDIDTSTSQTGHFPWLTFSMVVIITFQHILSFQSLSQGAGEGNDCGLGFQADNAS